MKIRSFLSDFVVIFLIISLMGCASQTQNVQKFPTRNNFSDIGVVLISIGRSDSKTFFSKDKAPILGYDVYAMYEDRIIESDPIISFEPEPKPAVYFNMGGQLGKGKYGFIHIAKLPAGKYALMGREKDVSGYTIPLGGGGVGYVPGTEGSRANAFLSFKVEANKLNYIGEVLATKRDLSSEGSLVVGDQSERDFKYAYNNRKEYASLEVVKNFAFRLDSSPKIAFAPGMELDINQLMNTHELIEKCNEISALTANCSSPYKLEKDCSFWSGATKLISINGIESKIAGTADGKIIFLMGPKLYGNLEEKPKFIQVKDRHTEALAISVWSVMTELKKHEVQAEPFIQAKTMGSIMGVFLKSEKDMYAILNKYAQ